MEGKEKEDDLFDCIVMAEERFHSKGFEEGVADGKRAGLDEGYHLGKNHGGKLGTELGFYYGFILTWKDLLDPDSAKNGKKLAAMESLLELIISFPQYDPQDESIQDLLAQIRGKFKKVSSLLNLSTTYGSNEASAKTMSF